jgi:hypothetical protein
MNAVAHGCWHYQINWFVFATGWLIFWPFLLYQLSLGSLVLWSDFDTFLKGGFGTAGLYKTVFYCIMICNNS